MQSNKKLLYSIGIIIFFSFKTLFFIDIWLGIKQLGKITIAILISYFLYKTPHKINNWANSFFIISNICLLFNLAQQNQINRWVNIFGLFIQFSEFAKISVILFLSKLLSENKLNFSTFIISSFSVIIPSLLVIKQPNLGTGLIILASGFSLIGFKEINFKKLLILSIIGLICSPIAWNKLLPYQKTRLTAFLNPTKDAKGASYQSIQSIIAVASGGIFGSDPKQNKLGFVPENHTDFLFTYFAEKEGFISTILLLIAILTMLMSLIEIHINSNNSFVKLFSIGIVFVLFFENVINISMNIGLLPITGIALPFFSYGGSSILSFFIALAILFNTNKH